MIYDPICFSLGMVVGALIFGVCGAIGFAIAYRAKL